MKSNRPNTQQQQQQQRSFLSSSLSVDEIQSLDQQHVWHPYATIPNTTVPCYPVEKASGCQIYLKDGRTLIDGMSSWWACIHGYNHTVLNKAAIHQLTNHMSHIMFGGLTHEPAVQLAKALTDGIPANNQLPSNQSDRRLDKVFFCDSGSVSIEIAMKMALQYHYNLNHDHPNNNDKSSPTSRSPSQKSKFLTIRGGYHGDTFEAMSVCDPVNGMHHLFSNVLAQQIFCQRPIRTFDDNYGDDDNNDDDDILEVKQTLEERHLEIAAIIVEPIVQGAGGMRMYHPQYLTRLRELCDEYGVLLIFDEIATGFGRTGKLFAMDHIPPLSSNDGQRGGVVPVVPDILCVGKALSGGYVSFAATITSSKVAQVFSRGPAGVLMHGPTFMGNPLACAVSLASWNVLQTYDLKSMIGSIEHQLQQELEPCRESPYVQDVRVLGAIGVVEMKQPMDMKTIQSELVNQGVWLRPFGKLLYTMPPFIIKSHELRKITKAMVSIAMRKPR